MCLLCFCFSCLMFFFSFLGDMFPISMRPSLWPLRFRRGAHIGHRACFGDACTAHHRWNQVNYTICISKMIKAWLSWCSSRLWHVVSRSEFYVRCDVEVLSKHGHEMSHSSRVCLTLESSPCPFAEDDIRARLQQMVKEAIWEYMPILCNTVR